MLKKKISIDIFVTIILFSLGLLFFIMEILSIMGVNLETTTYFAGGTTPLSVLLASLPILLIQAVPFVGGVILAIILKRKGLVVFWVPIAVFALWFDLDLLMLAFV